MQYFLTVLRDIFSIPVWSEIVICHKGLCLDPASQFQGCNLPHEPTLHICFSSHPDAHPRTEPVQPESVGEAQDPPADPTNTLPSADKCRGTLLETCDTRSGKGYMGMALWIRPPHASVQDPSGKTLQHFPTAPAYNFAIPSYDCGVYHGLILLNPDTRVFYYRLPNGPTLRVCLRGELETPPTAGAGSSEPPGTVTDQTDSLEPSQANTPSEPRTNIKKGGYTTFPQELPDQVLVQISRGKTQVLLFYPGVSIAGNLASHAVQLHLPPPEEFYILWGSRIIQADLTGTANGLSREPLLRILLRDRGGMRGGVGGAQVCVSSADRGKYRCIIRVGSGLRRPRRDGQTQEQGTVTTAKVGCSFR